MEAPRLGTLAAFLLTWHKLHFFAQTVSRYGFARWWRWCNGFTLIFLIFHSYPWKSVWSVSSACHLAAENGRE